MAYIAWQATVTNDTGDVVSGAEITVINEATGLAQTLYSDKNGAALTNPFNADANGFFQFYVDAGTYRITAQDLATSLQRQWDNVVINPYSRPSNSNYMAVSGTANAIVLSSQNQTPINDLQIGDQFRFKAFSQNTGPVTIKVDGASIKSASTVTGAACPADYIRNDVETVITYNGTGFTVDRMIERGSNANGSYTRWADGCQECTFNGFSSSVAVTFSADNAFIHDTPNLIFPASFQSSPSFSTYSLLAGRVAWASVASFSDSLISIRVVCNSSVTADLSYGYTANGYWY